MAVCMLDDAIHPTGPTGKASAISGAGLRSRPDGATAPRAYARSQANGVSARRLREMNEGRRGRLGWGRLRLFGGLLEAAPLDERLCVAPFGRVVGAGDGGGTGASSAPGRRGKQEAGDNPEGAAERRQVDRSNACPRAEGSKRKPPAHGRMRRGVCVLRVNEERSGLSPRRKGVTASCQGSC